MRRRLTGGCHSCGCAPRAIIDRYLDRVPSAGEGAFIAPGARWWRCPLGRRRVGLVRRRPARRYRARHHRGSQQTCRMEPSIHVADDGPCLVGADVVVGHRAMLHACRVEDACLIGNAGHGSRRRGHRVRFHRGRRRGGHPAHHSFRRTVSCSACQPRSCARSTKKAADEHRALAGQVHPHHRELLARQFATWLASPPWKSAHPRPRRQVGTPPGNSPGAIFDIDGKRSRIAELDGEASQPNFWNAHEQAQTCCGNSRA